MPQGKTYVKIASQTLSGASASVTFSNLPQNYTDLVCIITAAIDTTNTPSLAVRINSDTGNNYSSTILEGNGVNPYSQRYSGARNLMQFCYYTAYYSSNQSNAIVQFLNYSNSTTYKTALCRFNITGGNAPGTTASVGLYRANTNPITSITFSPDFGSVNFVSGSTFTIYGIAASKAPKAIGGTITTDGSYWIHTFTSSGQFVTQESITSVDYLVVAGGGGGGGSASNAPGGGGAGGLRSTVTATGGGGSLESVLSLAENTVYTVTVGAGGAGGIGDTNGASGNNSVFSSVTSTGGGGGGSGGGSTGVTGGSGGGGGGSSGGGAAGTANQGYAGGASGPTGSKVGGGGGGGAGAAGTAAGTTNGNGGIGGNGVATSISGSSVTYAGGGGGGHEPTTGSGAAGGSGGGGSAVVSGNGTGTAGTANLGAGGGAAGRNSGGGTQTGGAGGSGIVIVRYAI